MNNFEELKNKLNKVKIEQNKNNILCPKISIDGIDINYENYEITRKNGEFTYLTVSIPCILKVEGEI